MMLQIPNILADPCLRTLALVTSVWDITGCLSALVLLVGLNIHRLHARQCAHRFAEVCSLALPSRLGTYHPWTSESYPEDVLCTLSRSLTL